MIWVAVLLRHTTGRVWRNHQSFNVWSSYFSVFLALVQLTEFSERQFVAAEHIVLSSLLLRVS